MSEIELDMNDPEFQDHFFHLEKQEQNALINTLKKIRKLKWIQVYNDNGLNWEAITSKETIEEKKPYSFRFSKKYRALALRKGNVLKLISLHTDHDSAYH